MMREKKKKEKRKRGRAHGVGFVGSRLGENVWRALVLFALVCGLAGVVTLGALAMGAAHARLQWV